MNKINCPCTFLEIGIFSLPFPRNFENFFLWGGGFIFFVLCSALLHLTDSTVPTDTGIEPRTVATGALAVRRSNQ
jgi:hypothetical protein